MLHLPKMSCKICGTSLCSVFANIYDKEKKSTVPKINPNNAYCPTCDKTFDLAQQEIAKI